MEQERGADAGAFSHDGVRDTGVLVNGDRVHEERVLDPNTLE